MNQEEKTCQNCKQNFRIEPEDFGFYKKINVPPPTWCPECRFQRRLAVCNERTLYKRKCDLCGRDMISMHPEGTTFPVYCLPCWRSDGWDETSYRREYDFSKPFFEQFAALKNQVPRYGILQQGNMERSEYCNRASNDKNCYLCFRTNFSEQCLYSHHVGDANDCIDCMDVQKSERIYEGINCFKCYNCYYVQECSDCTDSYFLYDCRNCSNCFGCANLRNQQYYIFNQPYSKEEYFKKLEEFRIHDRAQREKVKKEFQEFRIQFIHEETFSTRSTNVSGNWLIECKNVKNSFGCRAVEDSKYVFDVIEAEDCMDYTYFGRGAELVYESSNCGYSASRIQFSNEAIPSCHDIFYSDACLSSAYLFGCVGVRSREYCILNKKYSKEGYDTLISKIKKHMDEVPYTDRRGRIYKYGEFFPPEINHFAYNETVAQEHFPLTEEEAIEKGYAWKNPETKDYKITINPEDLPDHIKDIGESVLKEVIGCAHEGECNEQCTTAFKVVRDELQFYRKMNIPLPRLCPNCRHYQRLKQRNPLKLWHRKCQCAGVQSENGTHNNTASHFHGTDHCPNEFETSYAPERKEIVYCEQRYQSEVV